MSENMPKVNFKAKSTIFTKVIENIVNGEYSDAKYLGDECKKLVDSI